MSDIDISDTFDTQLHDLHEVPTFDYTADIPAIPGTTDLHPIDCPCIPCDLDRQYEASYEPGCECEIDWKCGVCRANGYRHSRLDAAGLGPDAIPEGH